MILIFCLVVQLDNADEQAAQVRRELDSRLQASDEMARVSNCLEDNVLYPTHCIPNDCVITRAADS